MVTEITQGGIDEIHVRWEPLFNNLGHCCRKNKKYDEAIRFHQQALVLKPQNSYTYTAIGFIHALRGNLDTAVSYLHRSLALRRDDIVTTELLKSCLAELMSADNVVESLDKDDFDGQYPSTTNDINPTKLRCTKIIFDDDSNNSHQLTDLDMTMDL